MTHRLKIGPRQLALSVLMLASAATACTQDDDASRDAGAFLCGPTSVHWKKNFMAGPEIAIEVGDLQGTTTEDNCDEADQQVNVYSVVGLPTDAAIAVGPSPAEAELFIPTDARKNQSDELRRYLETHQ